MIVVCDLPASLSTFLTKTFYNTESHDAQLRTNETRPSYKQHPEAIYSPLWSKVRNFRDYNNSLLSMKVAIFALWFANSLSIY